MVVEFGVYITNIELDYNSINNIFPEPEGVYITNIELDYNVGSIPFFLS